MMAFFLLTNKVLRCLKDIVASHSKTPVLKTAKTKFERKKKNQKRKAKKIKLVKN